MNPETVNKCYPCGKVETTTEFLINFTSSNNEEQKVCFKCMIIIVGMTFEEDLCFISDMPPSYVKWLLSFFKKSKYKKCLIPMPLQEIINRQKKSDCYINPAVFMPREKRQTYFVLTHIPFERN